MHAMHLGAVAIVGLACGCSSKVVIATWSCSQKAQAASQPDSGGVDASDAFEFPWSTGFEDGFCDYLVGGYCYSSGSSTYKIVTSPVHSGHYAAAYTIVSDPQQQQSRCFRQGAMPAQAYYGAWYYVPSVVTVDLSNNWNLIHFQGSEKPYNTLDVSLVNDNSGGLRLSVYDAIGDTHPDMSRAPSIPIGSWFHIVVFLKRAADDTGEYSVYQDGVPVLPPTSLATDKYHLNQWYVGNFWYTLSLSTSESTVYVDDVSVTEAL